MIAALSATARTISIPPRGIQLLQAETPRVRADKGTHVHGFGNTHYWLDPENSKPITAAILEALDRLVPGERRYFEANRKRFLDQLDKRLKIWLRAMAPYKGTRAVAVHETWPYFAQRFGLVVVGVVEPTPESRLPHRPLLASFRRCERPGLGY